MEWPGKKENKSREREETRKKRGISGKDEDREVFEAQVFLI